MTTPRIVTLTLSLTFAIAILITNFLVRPITPVDAAVKALGEPNVTVVASNLNNPRGLNFGPDGSLFVTEAGMGGAGPCVTGPEGDNCFGTSGSVTRVNFGTGEQSRIVTGLPSLAAPDGTFALGPHDVSFQGLGNGYVTIGLGLPPSMRSQFGPGGANLASLFRFNPGHKRDYVADLGAYEETEDPNGDDPDSDPYGLLALQGRQVYTDAGGNALNQVTVKGQITTLAVFPNRNVPFPGPNDQFSMDAVPTTVAVGPDRAYYVGQLTGFPFPPNDANIYRVPAGGGTPEIYLGGFTNIIDIAFAPDGTLYVLEISSTGLRTGIAGALIRVDTDGTRTTVDTGPLFAPGGVAIGSDGALYITNKSVLPGAGEVLRVEP
jgi:hypothetical protein